VTSEDELRAADLAEDQLVLFPRHDESDDETAQEADDVKSSKKGERAGLFLAALVMLAVPSLIVLALFLPGQEFRANSAGAEEATTAGLDESEIPDSVDVAEPDIEVKSEEPDSVPAEAVPEPTSTTESTTTTQAATTTTETTTTTTTTEAAAAPDDVEIPNELADLAADAIEITVYDESPPVDGTFAFALRLKSVSAPVDVDTALFTVAVHSENDEPVSTTTMFVHETLPVGSSALATVRAAASTGDHQVVVLLGDVEVARAPISPS